MICPKCGTAAADDARFCASCGTALFEETIGETASNIADEIEELAGEVGAKAADVVDDLVDAAKDKAADVADSIDDFVDAAKDKAADFLQDAAAAISAPAASEAVAAPAAAAEIAAPAAAEFVAPAASAAAPAAAAVAPVASAPAVNPADAYAAVEAQYAAPATPAAIPTVTAAAAAAVPGSVPEQGMKWHKFLIYFALWAGAVLYVIMAIVMFTGAHYTYNGENMAALVYMYYPGLKTVDIIFGILYIVLAALAIFARFKLAKFNVDGPKFLIIYLAAALVVSLLYIIIGSVVIGQWAGDASTISSFVVSLVMIFVNKVYYDKRKHLFINKKL